MEFYAPMFLFYSLYDGAEDKFSIIAAATLILKDFYKGKVWTRLKR